MPSFGLAKEPLGDRAPGPRDLRQELRQCDGRVVRVGPATARAGGHENDSSQYRTGLAQKLSSVGISSVVDALLHCSQAHLLQHESAVASRAIDQMRVPL